VPPVPVGASIPSEPGSGHIPDPKGGEQTIDQRPAPRLRRPERSRTSHDAETDPGHRRWETPGRAACGHTPRRSSRRARYQRWGKIRWLDGSPSPGEPEDQLVSRAPRDTRRASASSHVPDGRGRAPGNERAEAGRPPDRAGERPDVCRSGQRPPIAEGSGVAIPAIQAHEDGRGGEASPGRRGRDRLTGSSPFVAGIAVAWSAKRSAHRMGVSLEHTGTGAHDCSSCATLLSWRAHLLTTTMRGGQRLCWWQGSLTRGACRAITIHHGPRLSRSIDQATGRGQRFADQQLVLTQRAESFNGVLLQGGTHTRTRGAMGHTMATEQGQTWLGNRSQPLRKRLHGWFARPKRADPDHDAIDAVGVANAGTGETDLFGDGVPCSRLREKPGRTLPRLPSSKALRVAMAASCGWSRTHWS